MYKHIQCKCCLFEGRSNEGVCPSCGNKKPNKFNQKEFDARYNFFRKFWTMFSNDCREDINYAMDEAEDSIKSFILNNYKYIEGKKK